MTERAGLIRSRYFDKRDDLALGADEIVVISSMRNELQRLPYFLEYYRGLGVDRFLFIDNNSSDGTREFLAEQPDVEYFYTDRSYNGSGNGRMWVQEVAETYATGHWVLNVDPDELLVYPGVELFGIRDLCNYLDSQGYEGLFTVLLDLYSDVPLDQTRYERGTDFRTTCKFFEVDSYRLGPAEYPPFLNVWGGPRGRLAAAEEGPNAAFQQRKIPLVKWNRGFSYVVAAHAARFLQLADATGALLHFKYFSTWVDTMVNDHARGDRNPHSYAFYKGRVDHDLCFYGSHSHRYTESRDLVQLGVMASTGALRQFYAAKLRARGEDSTLLDALLPERIPAEGGFTLRSIASLWRFANNPHMARYFGQLKLAPPERKNRVHEMSKSLEVVDVWPDRILVRIGRAALHDWHSPGLALAAYVDGRLLARAMLDSTASGLEVDVDSLRPNIYRWNVDVRGAARAGATRSLVQVFLVDTTLPSAAEGTGPAPEDVRLFSRAWFHEQVSVREIEEYRGAVESYAEGELRGWALDVRAGVFNLPVAIYVDGRLASHAHATVSRPGLASKMGCPTSAGRGFQTPIPLGYFRDLGIATARVEARIAGMNVNLARTPFDAPTDTDSLEWEQGRGWYVPTTRARSA